MRILVLALLLVGCGSEDLKPRSRPPIVAVGGFEPYLDLFLEQGRRQGEEISVTDLVMKYDHIAEEHVLAYCITSTVAPPTVVVDPDVWERLPLVDRELLMFHELGHCILHRDHVTTYVSIMNPYLLSSQVFAGDQKHLLTELFDPSKPRTLSLADGQIQ